MRLSKLVELLKKNNKIKEKERLTKNCSFEDDVYIIIIKIIVILYIDIYIYKIKIRLFERSKENERVRDHTCDKSTTFGSARVVALRAVGAGVGGAPCVETRYSGLVGG